MQLRATEYTVQTESADGVLEEYDNEIMHIVDDLNGIREASTSSLTSDICEFIMKYNLTMKCSSDLMDLFRRNGFDSLPKDPRYVLFYST